MEALEINAIQDSGRMASGMIPGVDPLPIARGQFTPGDVGQGFSAVFLDESVCRRWILTEIHGDGEITCPKCHAPLFSIALRRFWEGLRICCRSCGKFFTARTGTFLDGCHMDFREIILLAVFLHFNVPAREIARILKMSPETVRLWDIKFHAIERVKGMVETIFIKGVEHGSAAETEDQR